MFYAKCNCGREVRYSHGIGGEIIGSCNKCTGYPTYNRELEALKSKYKKLSVAANDLITFREGTDYYKEAESVVVECNK